MSNIVKIRPSKGIAKRQTILGEQAVSELPRSILLRMSGAGNNHESSEPFLTPVEKYIVFDGILYAIHYSVERHPAYAGEELMLAPPPCYRTSVVFFTVSEVTRGVKAASDFMVRASKSDKYQRILDDMQQCENLFILYISQYTPDYVRQRREEYPILNPVLGY